MYGEEWDCDEDMESYYEGRAEGNEMLTEEQHKALDVLLKDAKGSIIENLKKESKRDLNTELRELKRFKENKAKVEKELSDAESKTLQLKYDIKNQEYELSYKERDLKKREKELEKKYQLAIGQFAFDKESILKTLLKEKLGQALKDFSLPKFYEVKYNRADQEKCSFCDENRKRHFTDDLGKTYEMNCPCSEKHYVYRVEEKKLIFTLGIFPDDLKADDALDEILNHSLLIKEDSYSRDYNYSSFLKDCFCSELETFEKYDGRTSNETFRTLEEAQDYAKYKQAKEDRSNLKNYMDLKLNNLLVDSEGY